MGSRRASTKRRGRKTYRQRSLKGGFVCGPACVPLLSSPAAPVVLGGLVTASMSSEYMTREGYEYKGEKNQNKNGKISKLKVRIELVKGKGKSHKGKSSKGKSRKGKSRKGKSLSLIHI